MGGPDEGGEEEGEKDMERKWMKTENRKRDVEKEKGENVAQEERKKKAEGQRGCVNEGEVLKENERKKGNKEEEEGGCKGTTDENQ